MALKIQIFCIWHWRQRRVTFLPWVSVQRVSHDKKPGLIQELGGAQCRPGWGDKQKHPCPH